MSNALTGRYAIQHARTGSKPSYRIMLLECIAVVVFFVLFALFATSLANAQSYLTAPAVPAAEQICSNPVIPGTPGYSQNLGVLTNPNPAPTPNPLNGVTNMNAPLVTIVPSGVNDAAYGQPGFYNNFRAGGTPSQQMIYYFMPGPHYVSQIIPGSYTTFIGAPGAVIEGIEPNPSGSGPPTVDNVAFSGYSPRSTNVTIQYLTIQDFGLPPSPNTSYTPTYWSNGNLQAFVVNQDADDEWTVQYNTIQNNHGAGVNSGNNGVISYNCIKNNGQYGISLYNGDNDPPALVLGYNGANSSTPLHLSIDNVIIDHNEIANSDSDDWENKSTQYAGAAIGCGCTGATKFWNSSNLSITNNYVHDSLSVGLWTDTDNADVTLSGNYIANNFAEGLFFEISYNGTITNNILWKNAIGKGQQFQANQDSFPISAIYISESGYDSRVDPAKNATFGPHLNISNNTLVDNWGGVGLWENPNRMCGDTALQTGANDGSSCTLVPTPAFTAYAVDNSTNFDCPANLAETAPTPYITDCRWKTQNVLVQNNTLSLNPANLPANCTPYCGFSSLISTVGSTAPYNTTLVEDNITYNQNNNFTGNTYDGTWSFQAHAKGNAVSYQNWQGTPTSRDSNNTGGFGQDVGSTYTPSGPYITGLSATTVPIGNNVTINGLGTSFGTTPGTVSFYGMAPITPATGWGNTAITLSVPTLATSGYVYVTNASGSGTSNAVTLTVPVTITGASGTGAVGSSVSIVGSGFGAALNKNTVAFNGMSAAPGQVVWGTDGKSITATVPSGVTAPVSVIVTVNGISSNSFAVGSGPTSPTITSLSPSSGVVTTSVTIAGTNFGSTQGSSTVKFNGTSATPTSWSLTSIVVPVPSGATTGNVVVTVGGVSTTGTHTFTVTSAPPSITSLSPTSGVVTTPVTITGTNFGSTQGSSAVSFNGTGATPTSWSATSIVVPVPSGATTGNVVVTVGGVASTGVLFTVSGGTTTNYLDSDTATLDNGVMGKWVNWYNETITLSPANTGAGTPASAHALSISTAAGSYGWGVQLSNYPGFIPASFTNPVTVSFSAMAVSGVGSTGSTAVLTAEWLNSAGTILRSDAVTTTLTSAWQSQSMGFPAPPANTATLLVTLTGNGAGGTTGLVIYADSFFVGH